MDAGMAKMKEAMALDPSLAVMDEESDKKCIMMVTQMIMSGNIEVCGCGCGCGSRSRSECGCGCGCVSVCVCWCAVMDGESEQKCMGLYGRTIIKVMVMKMMEQS